MPNSASIHNNNCWAYFTNLASFSEQILPILKEHSPYFNDIKVENYLMDGKRPDSSLGHKEYFSTFSYANAYTALYTFVEANIGLFDADTFDSFILSMYENDSEILTSTYRQITTPIERVTHEERVSKRIAKALHDTGNKEVPENSPSQLGQTGKRLQSWASPDHKPQSTTGLPTLRRYPYQAGKTLPLEIRMSTQIQREGYQLKVSPLFKRFLEAKGRTKEKSENKVAHLYINNLGKDGVHHYLSTDNDKTKKLSELEKIPDLAVITLPAQGGLMGLDHYLDTTSTHTYADVLAEFLHIAEEDGKSQETIRDFHISTAVRALLFTPPTTQHGKLTELIENSFRAMNIGDGCTLTTAQRQAVYVHFIKFELTNHILKTLNPLSFNISCKEAIDRGALGSAYYHLMTSIQEKNPMSMEDFEQAVHAAASAVKGRGMNDHLNILWNAIHCYVEGKKDEINADPKLKWLIEWRDKHCPPQRLEEVVRSSIQQLGTQEEPLKQILDNIQLQMGKGVSGKRLFLKIVGSIKEMYHGPTGHQLLNFENLTNQLTIRHPKTQILVGILKKYLGIVLGIKSWARTGAATAAAGTYVDERRKIQDSMTAYVKGIRDGTLKPPSPSSGPK
ncbi:MAG: hypothetical protein NTW94_08165 [Legionellales bacterium]|nr:hypothetical protein [Legionellales bacterium]